MFLNKNRHFQQDRHHANFRKTNETQHAISLMKIDIFIRIAPIYLGIPVAGKICVDKIGSVPQDLRSFSQ